MQHAKGKTENAISPTRSEDYAEWYQQIVKVAELAENSPVRGCMVIKPWGYGIWENIQQVLDRKFKDTGHVNAYFPLLIPLSFFEKEAQHVEGFAKECAVVTHHRLAPGKDGGLVPAGELEEPLVIRPTSETIIGAMFAKWVQSYRDLPILINQWANVMRWEMRTRLFLRTAEFLWQEGHTVHATAEEAQDETRQMLDIYANFAREHLAMPVVKGEKCSWERFPGAVATYSIEAMMQDRKALQAGTSHFLGQNFAKGSDIKFLGKDGREEFAWTTSWGVSTRLIGALVMVHSDDDGLVVPPRIAPKHVVILPIYRNDSERETVLAYARQLRADLLAQRFGDGRVEVELDDRDMRGGEKTWFHIKRGVPIRVEVGPRDVAAGQVFVGRRDKAHKDRASLERDAFVAQAPAILDEIQANLLARAEAMMAAHTRTITDRAEFEAYFTPADANQPEIHGGFALAPFVDAPAVEEALAALKVTVRCLPLDAERRPATCMFTGQATDRWAIYAKAY